MDIERPVIAGLHIVLALPDQLHRIRLAPRLGRHGGLRHVIGIRHRSAAEGAAGVSRLDLDLGRRHAKYPPCHDLIDRLQLRAGPNPDLVAVELHDRVHRLHGRMSEVGEGEFRLDGLSRPGERGVGVALLAGDDARRRDELAVLGEKLGRASLFSLCFVPLDLDEPLGLERRPGPARIDGNALRNDLRVQETLDRFGRARVDFRRDAAEPGGMDDRRRHHAVEMDVLGEDRLAGDLGFGVETLETLADIGEVRRVLERGVLRHVELGRLFRELPERPRAAGLVRQHALSDGDFGGGHAPRRGRRGDEHGARDRARLPVLHEGIGDRGRAAGALHLAEQEIVVFRGVGRRELGPHLPPIRVQFFGDEGRQARGDPLPLVEMLDQDRDRVVGRDAHERIGRERRRGPRRRRRKLDADDEADPGASCDLDESPARLLNGHGAQPFMISAAR